jgi:hypothetical protein
MRYIPVKKVDFKNRGLTGLQEALIRGSILFILKIVFKTKCPNCDFNMIWQIHTIEIQIIKIKRIMLKSQFRQLLTAPQGA